MTRRKTDALDPLHIAVEGVYCIVQTSPHHAAATSLTWDFSVIDDDPLLPPDLCLDRVVEAK